MDLIQFFIASTVLFDSITKENSDQVSFELQCEAGVIHQLGLVRLDKRRSDRSVKKLFASYTNCNEYERADWETAYSNATLPLQNIFAYYRALKQRRERGLIQNFLLCSFASLCAVAGLIKKILMSELRDFRYDWKTSIQRFQPKDI